MVHPTTGDAGLWLELSVDPPGTLTGMVWPARLGGELLAAYNIRVNGLLLVLFTRATFGQIVIPTVTFARLSPLTLDPEIGVVINEGDMKSVRVR